MIHVNQRMIGLAFLWLIPLATSSAWADAAQEVQGEVQFSPFLKQADLPELANTYGTKFSRDGSRLASAHRSGFKVWDAESGRLLHRAGTAETSYWPNRLDLDDQGRFIAVGSQVRSYPEPMAPFHARQVIQGSLANLWDEATGRYTREFVNDRENGHLYTALSGDGSRLACFDRKLNAKLWDATTGNLLAEVAAPKFPNDQIHTSQVGFDINGRASRDATRFAVRISVATGENLDYEEPSSIQFVDLERQWSRMIPPGPEPGFGYNKVTVGHGGRIVAGLAVKDSHPAPSARNAGLNVQQRRLVTFDFDSGAVRTKTVIPSTEAPPVLVDVSIVLVEFSPGDDLIALGTADGRLDLFDTLKGTPVARLRISDGPIRAVAFPPGRVRVVADRKMIFRPGEAHSAGPARLVDYRLAPPP